MSQGGPIPKRSEERRRANKDVVPVEQPKSGTRLPSPQPEADPTWHPIAIRWWDALGESGQAIFYEPSDWAQAYFIAEAMTSCCSVPRGRMSSEMFKGVITATSSLMTTEGERRRLRIELKRADVEDTETAGVVALRDYKKNIGG